MKSFKSYFLDFTMVFLAVFLGFWAESYRNDLADSNKIIKLKNAIKRDVYKDIKQIDEYVSQANYNLSMIERMDSLLYLYPQDIDQKDYYNTLVNYSVAYMFVPSDKSLAQAEEAGIIQNEESDSLSYYVLKYQYFLTDLKLVEKLLSDEYAIYLQELVPKITEPELYRKVWRYPLKELDEKKGIKEITLESKRQLRYFFANVSWYYDAMKVNADSMKVYGYRIIDEINNN